MLSKLKKMKMPGKKGEEMEMEGMEEGASELEAAEESYGMEEDLEEPGLPKEAAEGDLAALEAISDDDLLAELKKRGLMSQLSEEEAGEEESIMA